MRGGGWWGWTSGVVGRVQGCGFIFFLPSWSSCSCVCVDVFSAPHPFLGVLSGALLVHPMGHGGHATSFSQPRLVVVQPQAVVLGGHARHGRLALWPHALKRCRSYLHAVQRPFYNVPRAPPPPGTVLGRALRVCPCKSAKATQNIEKKMNAGDPAPPRRRVQT